jgi:NitT/TauT family transport system ATP-binding protein
MAADDAALLQADGLAHGFAAGAPPVFEHVHLEVRAREIVALLGVSGCGKSTLLRLLAGLEAPRAGQVRFMGEPLVRPHPRAALLFQRPGLLPWRRVAGNVGFGLDFKRQPKVPAAERHARVAEALAAVGLAGQERRWPAQLSGGMAQRVALARALARQPALLLADEPFSALDAITRAEMQALLVALVHRWHSAVLLVTHDVDEALAVADRIMLMSHPAPGRPAELHHAWTVPAERSAAQQHRLHLEILAALRGQPHPAPIEIAA